jgi:two-component system, chemotaxis family, protein-glutamate methylesterase/glutaminase
MTRVLVVDDSAFMRHSISRALTAQADLEVVGAAADGIEALDLVRRLQPDVVTLDIEMPRMDGLRTLEILMRDQPVPVVMLSSHAVVGAPATIRALELGAVDFVAKPAPPAVGASLIEQQLVRVVRAAAGVKVRRHGRTNGAVAGGAVSNGRRPDVANGVVHAAPKQVSGVLADRVVVIGCSTGGPKALIEVIPHLPANLPAAVLVVQHMPAGFTRSLAERIDRASALYVREAQPGDVPCVGLALLAPGGQHMELSDDGTIVLHDGPAVHGVRPSVDVLLNTVPRVFGARTVVAILTGMGTDGADGSVRVRAAGGQIIAEDASTTAVYGMPRAIAERGLADRQVPLPDMAAAITDMVLKG